jgi:hypothetical protein
MSLARMLLHGQDMAQLPVLVPSALTPRWRWAVRRRARGLAAGAGALAAGAVVALWCTRPEMPPPLPDQAPAIAAAAVDARTATRPISGTAEARDVRDAGETIQMAPVVRDGGVRVVLRSHVDGAWVSGPASLTEEDGLLIATRPLSDAGRAEVAGAMGAALRLVRPDGGSCRAVVTGAVALARVDAGDEIDRDADAAWNAADDSRVVAGDLELDGDCDGALWARSASLAQPAPARIARADSATRRAAIAALEKRPEYRELTDGSGSEEFAVVTVAAGGETIVAAQFLSETCVGKMPVLTGFWRLEPGAGGELRFLGAEERIVDIVGAADADGDGRLEVLTQDDSLGVAVMHRGAGRYRVAQRAPVDIRGCRC